MDINNLVTGVFTFATTGLVVVVAAYYLIKPHIERYLELKFQEVKKEERPPLLLLRLQAHERLLLFIERINPSNLLVRLHQQGISVKDMQYLLLNEIRAEYQHNVAQQLYVNPRVWSVINGLKDDTLAMIGNAARDLAEEAEGVDLSKKILQQMAAIAEDPYQLTLELIKKDIQQLF
jgi:hypothetical protein